MNRRVLITAASLVATLAASALAQTPNVVSISGIPIGTPGSPTYIANNGNAYTGTSGVTTLGAGTLSRAALNFGTLTGGAGMVPSADGTTIYATGQHGATGLPPNIVAPAPSPLTFAATNTCTWYSTNGGASWTRLPLFASQGLSSPQLNTVLDVSDDGRYAAGTGLARIVWSGGTLAENARTHGWVYDRQTNTMTELADTIGGPTGLQGPFGRGTFIVRSMSNDGSIVVGSGQQGPDGGSSECPVVWERNGSGVYVPTRLTSSINVGGARECRVSRDGSTIIGTSFDFSPSAGVKWVKGGGSWVPTQIPTNTAQVASNLDRPTSYLTFTPSGQSVTPTAVNADGSVIVGTITYAHPTDFFGNLTAAFMWTAATGTVDLFDYIYDINPHTGIGIHTNTGVPSPLAVKTDSSGRLIIVTNSSIIRFESGPVCYAPTFLTAPGTPPVISACNSNPSVNQGAASGTGPFSYVWHKDGSPVILGPTIWGSNLVQNSFNPQALSIQNAQGFDVGTYFCRVTGATTAVCNPALTGDTAPIVLTAVTPIPTGDTCLGAIDLNTVGDGGPAPLTVAGLPRTATAVNTCAAINNNIIGASCVSTSNGDVWYRWTPNSNINVRLSTCAVTTPGTGTIVNDTVLTVYTAGPGFLPNGSDCTSTEIACNDTTIAAYCAASTQRATIENLALTGGETYYIRVAVKNPFTSDGTNYTALTIAAAPAAPASDDCANAETISTTLPVNAAFDTTNATTEIATVSCNPANGSGKDVWFKFSPLVTQEYRFSTCSGAVANPPTNAGFDTVVTIFDNCSGNEVACNNDQGAGVPTGDQCNGANTSRISRVMLNSGTTYYIRVAGANAALGTAGAAGPGNLNVSVAPPYPANDNCGSAQVVSTGGALPWSISGISTIEATTDGATSCLANSNRDLWYAFTPPSTPARGWRIQFCGWASVSPFPNSVLSIHTGCPGDASNQLACNDNVGNFPTAIPAVCGVNSNSRIDAVTLAAGTTYYIRVAGDSNSRASGGVLTIGEAPAPPANDDCATASVAVVSQSAADNAFTWSEATSQVLHGCGPTTSQRGAYDIWQTFIPAMTADYTFFICASNSAPIQRDPLLAIYANCADATSPTPTPIACVEDISAPFSPLASTTCAPATINGNTPVVTLNLMAGVPVLIRAAIEDFATNQLPSARPANPDANLWIVTDVLCCRGATCTMVSSSAACTAPSGVGAVKRVTTNTCTGNTHSGCCHADFDKNGVVEITDIFTYLNAWFATSTFADISGNGAGAPDITDIFTYLNAWFSGCGA